MPLLPDLSTGAAAVVDTAVPLLALTVIAVLARGIPRILLLVQVVYWSLSFVGRPWLLLVAQPRPAFGDNIADPRLAAAGYDAPVAQVLAPVTTGLWIYAALAACFVAVQRLRLRALGDGARDPLPRQSATVLWSFGAVWGVGVLGRVAAWATGTVNKAGEVTAANPYLNIFTTFGAVGALGLILYLRTDSQRLTAAIIGCAIAGELVWSVMQESKTPFMGAALAVAMRLAAEGVSRSRIVALGAGGAVVAGMFGWLQSFKTTATVAHQARAAEASYPDAVQPFLSVFRRFDLFEAATDNAYYHGPGYLSLSELLLRAPLNLVPGQLGAEKVQAGTDWAQRVRASSVDMSTISVSLAEGHINEGYRVAGVTGIVVESVLLLLGIAFVARCLGSRNLPMLTIGLAFVALPPLFERGVLGITETLGKSVQQAVLVAAIGACVWLARQLHGRRMDDRRRSGPPGTYPSLPSAWTTPIDRRISHDPA